MSYSEMFKIEIKDAICSMTEAFLERHTRDKVLTVKVMYSLNNYDNNYSNHRSIEIAIFRPSNYTQVGYKLNGEELYTHEADHDSCWRDGVNRCVKHLVRDIEVKIKEDGEDIRTIFKDIHIDIFSGIKLHENSYLKPIGKDEDRYNFKYSLEKHKA